MLPNPATQRIKVDCHLVKWFSNTLSQKRRDLKSQFVNSRRDRKRSFFATISFISADVVKAMSILLYERIREVTELFIVKNQNSLELFVLRVESKERCLVLQRVLFQTLDLQNPS